MTLQAGHVDGVMHESGLDTIPRRCRQPSCWNVHRTGEVLARLLAHSTYRGRWREMVLRSAMTLKLRTYAPPALSSRTPAAGLPEQVGGEGNWDYRYTFRVVGRVRR